MSDDRAAKRNTGTPGPEEFSLEEILAEYGAGREQRLMEAVEQEARRETEPAAPPAEGGAKKPPLQTEARPRPAPQVTEKTAPPQKPPAQPEDLLEELRQDLPPSPHPITLEDVVGSTVDAVMEEEAQEPLLRPRRGLFSRKRLMETEELYAPPEPEEAPEEIPEIDTIGPEPELAEAAADYRAEAKRRKHPILAAVLISLLPVIPMGIEAYGYEIRYWTGDAAVQSGVLLACLAAVAVLARQVFAKAFGSLLQKRCTSELLAVVSAVKRSSAQREAEEAAAQDAASVITETEAAYSSLTYDNGSATLSFHLDEAGKWVWSDDPEFPLDDSTIQSILPLLTNLKPQQTITEGDTLEAYGLDQPFATLTAAKPDGGTLTISLGNTTTDGNSYYMLMNEQESPVYIISNSLYTEMSKTIYDMCDLPELPQLTEENLQSVTVEGAASTLLRPIDKETSTDEETGEETVTVTWAASGEDVTGNATTASLLAELGALTFTKCVDYKPTDEAAALCGFDAPQATVTILYQNDTGTEGTLTLTFGSENLDQTGYYVRMEGDSTIYQMDTASVDTILSVAENGLTAADATGE